MIFHPQSAAYESLDVDRESNRPPPELCSQPIPDQPEIMPVPEPEPTNKTEAVPDNETEPETDNKAEAVPDNETELAPAP